MKKKPEKGITLIALVITIIILLILTGVSIAILSGKNGILEKAKIAKERTEQAEQEENSILKQYEELLDNYERNLPENTIDTEAGTLVKIPNNWYTKRADEIKTKDGTISIPGKMIANVYGVSDGQAQTIPVPYGFYYVGGTLTSGVVISDNQSDKNKYKGMEDVPTGVAYNEDGTVNREKCELQGNQFVWIPSSIEQYKKIDFELQHSTQWDKFTNTTELSQIKTYGGIYIGRYEAGTSEIILANNTKFENASEVIKYSDELVAQSEHFKLSKVIDGKITTRAGEIPYYHADYITALEMPKNMYDTNHVQSVLITGTMWDVIMKFVATDKTNYSDLKNSSWGNFKDNHSVIYVAKQGRYIPIDINNFATTNAVVSDNNYHLAIRTTASSENVKKKNLYDLAGNLWEWTQEMCYISNKSDLRYTMRGSGLDLNYSSFPVNTRGCSIESSTHTVYGFRPALYIR